MVDPSLPLSPHNTILYFLLTFENIGTHKNFIKQFIASKFINITNKVKKAAELMDIKLLDHLILTEDSYFSFADDGVI